MDGNCVERACDSDHTGCNRVAPQTGESQPRVAWLAAAGLLSVIVSIAGHQGGEMVYGEDLYTPALDELFGSGEASSKAETTTAASGDETPTVATAAAPSDAK